MMNEEESDPDWVTKPRLDSPRLHSPLPVHSLVWHSSEECLYTGDESGRIRKVSERRSARNGHTTFTTKLIHARRSGTSRPLSLR